MVSVALARIDENVKAAGISRAAFAIVCGVKPTTLSAAFNSIINLGGPREAELLTASYRLVEIHAACQPFALPPNANMVRVLVEKLQDGTLTTERIRQMVS